jgi:hypothetical protein
MERYALNLKKRYFFSENYAAVPSSSGFGFKKRNFGVFLPSKRSKKRFYDRNGKACGIISVHTVAVPKPFGVPER